MTAAQRRKELERLANRAARNITRRDLAIKITGGIEAPDTGPRMGAYIDDDRELHFAAATQPHPDNRDEE